MPFVKLDCGILDSTLWIDRDIREVFITALLMAQPFELRDPAEQLEVRNANPTGWTIPPGWYGFVEAAGVGIVRRAGIDSEAGLAALERLGSPEAESRSPDYDGRRLVRVPGGYLVLNFFKYRDRDYTAAARAKRYRERKALRRDVMPSHRDITQAEAEAKAEAKADKKVPTEPVPQKRDHEGVQAVFDHWKSVHGHPRAQLDDKRRRVIRAALANYTAEQLCESISGYLNSPHHMGVNDRNTRYDDICLFLRDASHIDAGIAFGTAPPMNVSTLTRRNIAAVEDWVPPEMRNAAN